MWGTLNYSIEREYHRDRLRDAENHRLVKLATCRTSSPAISIRIVRWLSIAYANLKLNIITRQDTPTVLTPELECCTC